LIGEKIEELRWRIMESRKVDLTTKAAHSKLGISLSRITETF
jgi:hypothetical protein